MKTRTCAGFAVILLLSVFLIGTGLCQATLTENTSTRIEVRKDGAAAWIIENLFLLKTEEDVTIFQQYMTEFEAEKQAYLSEFSTKTAALVSRASVVTGRSMSAENFQVTIDMVQTATATYGVITYRYDWVGFAKVEETRVTVGDVFEGGFYLFQGDVLTIQYPSGYAVTATVPTPDETKTAERTLTWYGRRNFGAGEPTVILDEKTVSLIDDLQGYLPLIIVAVAVVAGAFAGLYFLKRRKRRNEGGGGNGGSSLLQATLEKMEDDEDKVIKLLKSANGQLYQSLIAKHCGFSTSKTSELLTTMENKGIITRKLKGREKLVTLIEQD
ncbi:MAG: hypothetical protein FJ045_01350 [Crenarchaeota archaeon]|nr:hypothetical protein [Thermoproteota archaeon]